MREAGRLYEGEGEGAREALRRVTVFALGSADSRKEPLLEARGTGAQPGL